MALAQSGLISHFDLSVGGAVAIATSAVPDEVLSTLGKIAIGVLTAMLSAFASGAVRSWQERRRNRARQHKD